MVSGEIEREEVRYPIKRVCFPEDDVRKWLVKCGSLVERLTQSYNEVMASGVVCV